MDSSHVVSDSRSEADKPSGDVMKVLHKQWCCTMYGRRVNTCPSAIAAIILRVLRIQLDWVRVVDISEQNSVFFQIKEELCGVQLFLGFLLKSILCYRLKRLLDVDCFLGGCLKIGNIPFGLAPCHGPLLRYLAPCQQVDSSGHPTGRTWRLFSSTSILFPNTTNGKFSGSCGLAWMRNSSRQLSRVSNDLALLTSYTRTQQSAPR